MVSHVLAVPVLAVATFLSAQEGPVATQSIVTVDSKSPQKLTPGNLTVKVDRRDAKVDSVTPVPANGSQVALLIDDGLSTSIGRQLPDLKSFVTSLPAGVEIFIGYMQNGRVVPTQ